MHVSRPVVIVLALCVAAPVAWFFLRGPTGSTEVVRGTSDAYPPSNDTAARTGVPPRDGVTVSQPASEASAAVVAAEATTPQSHAEELRQMLARNGGRSRADLAELRTLLARAALELDGTERAEVLSAVGAWTAGRNLGWALDLVAQLGEFRDRHGLVRAVVEGVLREDPLRAAEWVGELTEPALRDSAYNVVGMKWAERDVTRALEWAMGLPEGNSRLSALEGLTWSWAQKDPAATYEWAARLPDAALRDPMFVKLAKMVAVQDPQRALAWAMQFPPGAGRDEALHYAVFQWAASDLGGAAAWTAQLADKRLQTEVEVAIARSWSNQEAQGATAWAADIQDPAARTAALKTTLRKWAEVNPAAAAQWIGAREATPANEEIFRSVTATLIESRPAATKAWLDAIAHPEWRAAGVQMVGTPPVPAPAKNGGLPKG